MNIRNDCSQVLVLSYVNKEIMREILSIFARFLPIVHLESFVIHTHSIVSIHQSYLARGHKFTIILEIHSGEMRVLNVQFPKIFLGAQEECAHFP